MDNPGNIHRLRHFVAGLAEAIAEGGGEAAVTAKGKRLLADLVAHDDWLPPAFAVPDPQRYQQYLLHCDSLQRFSVVSFVWGPGQSTPIHDHRTWGLIGMLRGAEIGQRYVLDDKGVPRPDGQPDRLEQGEVDLVSPTVGDIHRVHNAHDDRVSISIHVYGANIGAVRRATYGEDGEIKPFISGYTNTTLPNLWDLSKEA